MYTGDATIAFFTCFLACRMCCDRSDGILAQSDLVWLYFNPGLAATCVPPAMAVVGGLRYPLHQAQSAL
uniref:Uncharacterized protein n=1 Tax=Arundo donax TaxID=35708 RepID=A0A0A8ZZU6_ARUDO